MNALTSLAYIVFAIVLSVAVYWCLDLYLTVFWRVVAALGVLVLWLYIWWRDVMSTPDDD